MRELVRVCLNEWMKLVRRRRLWVASLLGVAMVGLFAYATYHNYQMQQKYNSLAAWRQQLVVDKQRLADLRRQQQHPAKSHAEPGAPDVAQQMQEVQDSIRQLQKQIAEATKSDAQWRQEQAKSVRAEQKSLAQLQAQTAPASGLPAAQHQSDTAQTRLALLSDTYRLTHNVRPLPSGSQDPYTMVMEFTQFSASVFLPLLAVILTADFVSGESTSGTIKLLLVRPVPRWKVLLGKWLVACLATALLTAGLLAVVWLIGCLQYGMHGARQPQVVGLTYQFKHFIASDGSSTDVVIPLLTHAHVLPMWVYLLASAGLEVVAMMVVATIAFLCSTLFKSAMASTAAALGAVVIGFVVTQFLQGSRVVPVLFPTHMNLAANWTGQTAQNLGLTVSLGTGLCTLAVWGVLSLVGAFVYFMRKDVLNA
ncbi:ABC transporter permease subunit [Alicyclobacillus shizuokensis]|uniref:ABC transporter permease subunit n=1 Tax=Alicyclobacillus shizuokensis TaxID=392014 RepID=UPI000833DDB2|nr:ABC transporter permease subunit [Alicyclobacillus shizuokensis]MCL6626827.1 ABC transporter permease subunit [Alicyclobacillus shizuokensis]